MVNFEVVFVAFLKAQIFDVIYLVKPFTLCSSFETSYESDY